MPQLLSVPGDQQQSIVDGQAEAEQGDYRDRVLIQVGDLREAEQQSHRGEYRHDRRDHRHASGQQPTEDEHEHHQGDRQGQFLGSGQIGLRLRVSLVVDDLIATDPDDRVGLPSGDQVPLQCPQLAGDRVDRGGGTRVIEGDLIEGDLDEYRLPVPADRGGRHSGRQARIVGRSHRRDVRYPGQLGRGGADRVAYRGRTRIDPVDLTVDDVALPTRRVQHVLRLDGLQRAGSIPVAQASEDRARGQSTHDHGDQPDRHYPPGTPETPAPDPGQAGLSHVEVSSPVLRRPSAADIAVSLPAVWRPEPSGVAGKDPETYPRCPPGGTRGCPVRIS